MPNVDSCVREAEAALCANEPKIKTYAQKITGLDEKNKTKIFRNKSIEQISNILTQCQNAIKNTINEKFYNGKNTKILLCQSSSNNKLGADIFHTLPNGEVVDIEVKFGEETNRNIGMDMFVEIFESKCFKMVLSAENRRLWRDKFLKDKDENAQLLRLKNAINLAIDEFNKFNKNRNFILKNAATLELKIINASGAEKSKNYLKFLLDGESFSEFRMLPTGVGRWDILAVEKLSKSVKRANVFVKNLTTNVGVKFTLNWKNNYNIAGLKVPAKLGFGTPSWNVWVSVEITHLGA